MARTRMDLEGYWEFILDPEQNLDPDTVDQGPAPRRIRVPGPWQAQFDDLRDYTGVAWYRLRFDLPKALARPNLADPTYVLSFGAVDYFCAVWLNGRYIGSHEGGYLPFEFCLDEALHKSGSNELLVRVLDPGIESDIQGETEFAFSEIPHGKQSWYGALSGIWQSVRLEVRHATHLTQLHVTPDVANEQARVDILFNQPTPAPLALAFKLTDPQRRVMVHCHALEVGAQEFHTVLPVPKPQLWDTHNPRLYEIEVSCYSGDLVVDTLRDTFGMRTISASPDGHLVLNGRPLYLRGALDQDYYPELEYTPWSDAELDRQFAQAKHMGLNCLRTHIKITDPRYYAAADRAGLLIWTEMPNWQNLTKTVKERARDTLAGMINRDWNHPSIIIWTLVNESWGVELVNPEHRQWLAETYDYVKMLDPNRLVVGNSACLSNFHVVTDIQDFHNYYSIPDHYQKWREWVENFSTRPSWVYAHAYQGINAWREFLRDPWNPQPRTLAPEVRRTGSEPMVISEFGNWSLPNVERLRACYNGRDPWWFETGMEWGDGAVYPHGVEARFKYYHLDKVFGTYSELAEASQWMQFQALKYQIEQIRLHPNIVGYIITEFTDVHWESNGLLDVCRNPKAHYDSLKLINGPDVLVPTWERVSYWQGERVVIGVTLSHFSDIELDGSRVEWYLDGPGEFRGTFDGLEPEVAQITEIGKLAFTVPPLERSQRARLHLQLFDKGGELVTRNFVDLYLFPRSGPRAADVQLAASPGLAESLRELGYTLTEDMSEADLVVADSLTDDLRWYIQRGGRVLWLAESKESQQTWIGGIDVLPRQGRRWQGDWANNFNWIRQDEMFERIPTDGLVDFAFADLTPENVIVGFAHREFASNVHAGLFVGWIHHTVALVGLRHWGDGFLMISTFRLREHLATHPIAATMVHDMIAYLTRRPTNREQVNGWGTDKRMGNG